MFSDYQSVLTVSHVLYENDLFDQIKGQSQKFLTSQN